MKIPVVTPVTWPDHRAFGHGSGGHRIPDTTALQAFGPLLHHLRGPRPASLSELLFDASDRLVFPLTQVMDPIVGLHAEGEYIGRLACPIIDTITDGMVDAWPRPGHRGVLAYTSGPPFDVPWYIERCTEAFDGTDVDVLITAGRTDLRWSHESPQGNVRVRPLVPMRHLLTRADALICHGGRNTLASAVEAGVPALVFAGGDPERGYFADTLARQGMGLSCAFDDWQPDRLRTMVADTIAGPSATAGPHGLADGADRVVQIMREAVTADVVLSSR